MFARALIRTRSLPPDPWPAEWLSAAHINGYPNNYLYLFSSPDGLAWTLTQETSIYPSTTYRDPSLRRLRGKWWIAATGDGADTAWGLISSTDLVTWTHVASPSTSGISATNTWAPLWFVDVDGSIHVLVSCKVSGAFGLYEMHPTNYAMTTWSTPVAITGTGFGTNSIDLNLTYWEGTYYLLWKDDDTSHICLSTSSSPFSGYSAVGTGDWAGWNSDISGSTEGPQIADIGTGWRIYFSNNTGFEAVHIYYSETTDRTMATGWTDVTALTDFDGYNHPLPITRP